MWYGHYNWDEGMFFWDWQWYESAGWALGASC